jgi:hypothetical protein
MTKIRVLIFFGSPPWAPDPVVEMDSEHMTRSGERVKVIRSLQELPWAVGQVVRPGEQIEFLSLRAHGAPGNFHTRKDAPPKQGPNPGELNLGTLSQLASSLQQIHRYMVAPGGTLALHSCLVGALKEGQDLLRRISLVLPGVKVVAGITMQPAFFRRPVGSVVVCLNGVCWAENWGGGQEAHDAGVSTWQQRPDVMEDFQRRRPTMPGPPRVR